MRILRDRQEELNNLVLGKAFCFLVNKHNLLFWVKSGNCPAAKFDFVLFVFPPSVELWPDKMSRKAGKFPSHCAECAQTRCLKFLFWRPLGLSDCRLQYCCTCPENNAQHKKLITVRWKIVFVCELGARRHAISNNYSKHFPSETFWRALHCRMNFRRKSGETKIFLPFHELFWKLSLSNYSRQLLHIRTKPKWRRKAVNTYHCWFPVYSSKSFKLLKPCFTTFLATFTPTMAQVSASSGEKFVNWHGRWARWQ